MMRRILSLMMLLVLLMLPAEALAASKKKVSITMPTKAGLLYVGESYTIKPRLKNVKLAQLTWESGDESVVRTEGNRLTGEGEGVAQVRASSGKVSATCKVIVLPKSITLEVGKAARLPYDKIFSYSSASKKIAKVSGKGVITAAARGSTKITVKYGKAKKTIAVKVIPEKDRVAKLDCADTARQIVLVEYEGGSKATVSFHEKKNGVWEEILSTPGYVGKNGLGKKKAGDKKTPVGTFNLTTPFGIKADPGSKLPYLKVTKYHYWCGSSKSPWYNQLCDSRVNGRSATSSDEKLINYKGVYNYCLFIDYNVEATPGKGSCIFLHCTGSRKYTGGCVAIPEKHMKKAIQWVESGAKIVIR